MDITIQSIDFDPREDLETFVHEKMNKLSDESEIIRANIALSMGADSDPDKYSCEIRLEVPGNDLFVKKNANTFEKAIASAVDALQRNRRRAKEKLMGRRRSR